MTNPPLTQRRGRGRDLDQENKVFKGRALSFFEVLFAFSEWDETISFHFIFTTVQI